MYYDNKTDMVHITPEELTELRELLQAHGSSIMDVFQGLHVMNLPHIKDQFNEEWHNSEEILHAHIALFHIMDKPENIIVGE